MMRNAGRVPGPRRCASVIVALVLALAACNGGGGAPLAGGSVKITMGERGFEGPLSDGDWFGLSVASIGDLDGDGVAELAVGAGFDDDGGSDRGAVWILFLAHDGRVRHQQKISDSEGGFDGGLHDGDVFGRSVAALGDFDGDGVADIAVGARQDDERGVDSGAVWILLLHEDGSVKSWHKIGGSVEGSWFGISVAALGDLDGDGVTDLAASSIFDDGGSVWILFLRSDGSVKTRQRIHGAAFGATGLFGESLAAIGDVDGDGVVDLAAGELEDDDGGPEFGAAWVLFLNRDGSLAHAQKISAEEGGFDATGFSPIEHFGAAVSALGDEDGDGTPDLVVGADLDDDGGTNRGAIWLLALDRDGRVKTQRKISETAGDFTGSLADEDRFGRSVARLGDLDRDGRQELAVGAIFDDAGGSDRGAVWLLHLAGAAPD